MEEIFQRFPGLGMQIYDLLDNKDLAKSRRVSKIWKNSIDREKTIWLRMIKKQVGDINKSQDWQNVVFKIPTDLAKALAKAVLQFYKSFNDENYSPLHITVEQEALNLSEFVLRRVDEKNPKSKKHVTPLHFAAEKGHLELCRMMLANTEEKKSQGQYWEYTILSCC